MRDEDARGHRRARHWLALVAIALVCVSVAATPAIGATQTSERVPMAESFVVTLEADGAARVTLATTFDLTTDEERRAFDALRDNGTVRERRVSRFADRMQSIAARTESDTGRDMAIGDASMAFRERDGTAVVALSVHWVGLATREDDTLVLREPFASGFTADRPVRVVGPPEYELSEVAPSPSTREKNTATWSAGTDFDGFVASFAPAESTAGSSEGSTSFAGPGFGVAGAFGALVVTFGVLLRRRRD